jgi:hypothetical protein
MKQNKDQYDKFKILCREFQDYKREERHHTREESLHWVRQYRMMCAVLISYIDSLET